MHNGIAVANRILEIADNSPDRSVTPMQLLKLAYLSHGWMLGLYGQPLLDESIEAWKYGPVVRSIYNAVKSYRDKPVKHIASWWIRSWPFSQEEDDIIKQVYKIYGGWDGIKLSTYTHAPGSPWDVIWRKQGQNAIIPNDLIEHYFRNLAEGSQQEQAAAFPG